MKKFLSALLALTCTATLALSVSAVGETYTAQKGTPIIDGTVDDVWQTPKRYSSHTSRQEFEGRRYYA